MAFLKTYKTILFLLSDIKHIKQYYFNYRVFVWYQFIDSLLLEADGYI